MTHTPAENLSRADEAGDTGDKVYAVRINISVLDALK